MWEKVTHLESIKIADYLLLTCIILAVIGAITTRPILFIIGFLFLIYLLLNRWYEKTMLKKLILQNPKKTLRLFPGEENTFVFRFQNNSIFPFINGTFHFQTNDIITIHDQQKHQHTNPFKLPLALISRGQTTLTTNIRADKRGIAKISNIHYELPHLFKFYPVLLSYTPFFHQEVIVYPRPKIVSGIEQFFQIALGDQQAKISPFENMENRVGTRDYQYGDPFKHINWKATAKAQTLQTNTYEKTLDKSFLIVVNLQDEEDSNFSLSSERLEKNLSYTAFLAQYATKNGYPFELFMNMKNPGNIPYIHLPEGEGNAHYMNTLELLARVHQHPIIVPISEMLFRIGQEFNQPKTMIVVGEILPQMKRIMEKWRTNHQILQVNEMNETAVLIPFNRKEMGKIAT